MQDRIRVWFKRYPEHLLAFLLAFSYLGYLVSSSVDVGIPRDESIYFYAADRFADWFEASQQGKIDPWSQSSIEKGFKFNREHPMLMKSLFGLSHRYLHQRWHWIADGVLAYRLPSMMMAALTVYLTVLLSFAWGGFWTALPAGLILMSMPRFFFHAHLSCFDLPVTFMWLWLSYAYLKALTMRRWIIYSGIILGFGLATKLNTFFAPFTLLALSILHLLHLHNSLRKRWIKRYIWIAVSMVFLGLGVFWLHWPWLYDDTIRRLGQYIGFHAHHVHYPVDYLGELQYRPPFDFSFPFVFTLFTLPAATLLLFGVGFYKITTQAWSFWMSAHHKTTIEGDYTDETYPQASFYIVQALVPLLIIAWPYTPIFGGTKHWMPAMPFWALIGGYGFKLCVDGLKLSTMPSHHLYTSILLFVMMLPGFYLTHHYGAHGPAWYNEIAGGVQGGASLRMPRNFWGYSSREILPYLSKNVSKSEGVFWHNATGVAVYHYKKNSWLAPQVNHTGDWTYPYANWGIYHDQREKKSEELDLWWAYGSELPVDGYFIDGVQQIAVYKNQRTQ